MQLQGGKLKVWRHGIVLQLESCCRCCCGPAAVCIVLHPRVLSCSHVSPSAAQLQLQATNALHSQAMQLLQLLKQHSDVAVTLLVFAICFRLLVP
jgi:hypothetical protein